MNRTGHQVQRRSGRVAISGVICALVMTATSVQAEFVVTVPSGMEVHLQEVLSDDGVDAALFRFRFVAPGISENQRTVEELVSDMEYLCQEFALPKLAEIRAEPSQIVVSLSAEATEFGVATPEVRQVFEAFSVQDSACIWEAF